MSRYRNGIAYPHTLKLDAKHLGLSSKLIALFKASVFKIRFEIEEEIKALYVEKINPKVIQGLAKILFNRAELSHMNEQEPVTNREMIFTLSADYWKKNAKTGLAIDQHRRSILKSADISDPVASGETEVWLFGDVMNNQKLVSFEDITAEDLIQRYNVEQVQGLLINTLSLDLRIKPDHDSAFRQIFHLLKFFQLMYELIETENDWLVFKIDGPASILDNARSYGIEIANFFPALLLLKVPWTLQASLKVPGRHRKFNLEINHDDSYQTFYREKGVWRNEKIELLIQRFNSKYQGEALAEAENRLIPLRNNRFLIPDIIIKDQKDQYSIMVEWVQYLSAAKIKWLENLSGEIPTNYVFAVKGKKTKFASLAKKLGKNLLIFTKELTAPALLKKLKEFRSIQASSLDL